MAYMKTEVRDYEDGKMLLASCPFYHDNPLCVNTCACFLPLVYTDEETGQKHVDFNFGWCGIAGRGGNLLSAVGADTEAQIRREGNRKKKV